MFDQNLQNKHFNNIILQDFLILLFEAQLGYTSAFLIYYLYIYILHIFYTCLSYIMVKNACFV